MLKGCIRSYEHKYLSTPLDTLFNFDNASILLFTFLMQIFNWILFD